MHSFSSPFSQLMHSPTVSCLNDSRKAQLTIPLPDSSCPKPFPQTYLSKANLFLSQTPTQKFPFLAFFPLNFLLLTCSCLTGFLFFLFYILVLSFTHKIGQFFQKVFSKQKGILSYIHLKTSQKCFEIQELSQNLIPGATALFINCLSLD